MKWLGEKNGFSSDFDTFFSSDISPDSFGVRGKPVLFLIFPPTPSESGEIRPFFSTPSESEKKDQEKGPGRGKNSPFFLRKKGPEIGGNNGSLRASIFDRCPEKTREKNASSGKTRPFSERKRTLVCRRKSLAIFDGRRRVPSDSEGIGGDDGKKIFDLFSYISPDSERFFSRAIYGSEKKTRVGENPSFFFQKKDRKKKILDLSLPLRGIRQIRDRGPRKLHTICGGPDQRFFFSRKRKKYRNRRNNGSLRASIFDRCPEKRREKNGFSPISLKSEKQRFLPGTDQRSVPGRNEEKHGFSSDFWPLFLKEKGRMKKKSWICLCPFGALDKSVIAQQIACDLLSDLRFFLHSKSE